MQNHDFRDHYLGDVPLQVFQCMFVATGNSVDTISPPLLDRCEVIACSGYVMDEKVRIARRFLLPKQIKENGLQGLAAGQASRGGVRMTDEVVKQIIEGYTYEAGVRGLEWELGKVCPAKAVEYSRSREAQGVYRSEVREEDVERILGVAKFEQEVREGQHMPGVIT